MLIPQTNLKRVYFNTSEELFEILKRNKFDGDFSRWVNCLIVKQLEKEGIIEGRDSP
jgi:hypothetical protein